MSRRHCRTAVAVFVGLLAFASSSAVASAKEPYFGDLPDDIRLGFVVLDQGAENSLGVALCNGSNFEAGRSASFQGNAVKLTTDAGSDIRARVGKKRVTGTLRLADGREFRFKVRPGQYGPKLVERCGASLAASSLR
jgi:hypothetical protein